MLNRRRFISSLLAGSIGLRRRNGWATALQQYFIPPTVHHITQTTAIIYFRLTEYTENGLAQISKGSEIVRTVPFVTDEESLQVQLVLDGLDPATAYQYRILIDGTELSLLNDHKPWTDLHFATPPYAFPLRIAAIGDTGFGDLTTAQLVERMATHSPRLLLHLGDIVYHMNEYNNDHWLNWARKYFRPFQPLLQRVPHYPTFGNHDMDAPTFWHGRPFYYWIFPPFNTDNYEGARSWYGFEYNDIQFLSLNTQLFYSHRHLLNAQNKWLDAKLARDDVRYTIVFCHVPPFTSSSTHPDDGYRVAQEWIPRFDAAAAKVALVLSGHAHIYERLSVNGVTYITAGAGSNVIYSEGTQHHYSKIRSRVPSYPIIDLYEDHIHLTTFGLSYDILDEVNVSVPGLPTSNKSGWLEYQRPILSVPRQ